MFGISENTHTHTKTTKNECRLQEVVLSRLLQSEVNENMQQNIKYKTTIATLFFLNQGFMFVHITFLLYVHVFYTVYLQVIY